MLRNSEEAGICLPASFGSLRENSCTLPGQDAGILLFGIAAGRQGARGADFPHEETTHRGARFRQTRRGQVTESASRASIKRCRTPEPAWSFMRSSSGPGQE